MNFDGRDSIAVVALIASATSIFYVVCWNKFQRRAKIAEIRRDVLSSLNECQAANIAVMQIIHQITNSPKTPKTDDFLMSAVAAHEGAEVLLKHGEKIAARLRDGSEDELLNYIDQHMAETKAMAQELRCNTNELTELSKTWLKES